VSFLIPAFWVAHSLFRKYNNPMEILAKLFGSLARVKLMRLFLMNGEDIFDIKDASRRTKVSLGVLRKEIRLLAEIGLIKERSFVKMHPKKNGEMDKKKANGWVLDKKFPFLVSLRNLVTEIAIGKEDVAARFKNVGQIKLLVIAGVFLDEPGSRVDILVVGDKLQKPKIEGVLRRLEAEVGKELVYGIMETEEFRYRNGIYDKFVRDILDYPHQVAINKINVS